MTGIGLNGHDITFLERNVIGVYEESLAGVLELNLHIFAVIGSGYARQVIKGVQLAHAFTATLAADTAAAVIEYEILIHIIVSLA